MTWIVELTEYSEAGSSIYCYVGPWPSRAQAETWELQHRELFEQTGIVARAFPLFDGEDALADLREVTS